MIVELEGLEVFGRHGVLEDERRDGRNFYDISLEVSEAALSDRLEDAVDYREVAACVQEVSDGSSSSSSRRLPGRRRRDRRAVPGRTRPRPRPQAGSEAHRPPGRVLGRYRRARGVLIAAVETVSL